MSALLAVRGATTAFAGRKILDHVSLEVSRGEIVALLGANGAGKTTLMRAALGLQTLAEGEALLGGEPVARLSAAARARRAAYLPQRPESAWALRVENLVALGRFAHGAAPERLGEADKHAVERALHACALLDLRGRAVTEISGGEAMRAHLARVLAQEAPLLMLDEPTASLDPAQSVAMAEILRAHASAGGGILFTSHDVALAARFADRVALMHKGRIIAEGAPLEALSPEALRQAYGRAGYVERREGAIVAWFGD